MLESAPAKVPVLTRFADAVKAPFAWLKELFAPKEAAEKPAVVPAEAPRIIEYVPLGAVEPTDPRLPKAETEQFVVQYPGGQKETWRVSEYIKDENGKIVRAKVKFYYSDEAGEAWIQKSEDVDITEFLTMIKEAKTPIPIEYYPKGIEPTDPRLPKAQAELFAVEFPSGQKETWRVSEYITDENGKIVRARIEFYDGLSDEWIPRYLYERESADINELLAMIEKAKAPKPAEVVIELPSESSPVPTGRALGGGIGAMKGAGIAVIALVLLVMIALGMRAYARRRSREMTPAEITADLTKALKELRERQERLRKLR
jgi:hypothetical protein